MSEEFSTEGMLDIYLFENGQLLEQLEATTLEKKDDDYFDEATINEFFRTMHTIKGSSGIMMYDNITEVSHKLEDVFYYIRESHPKHVDHLELVDVIFRVSDFISGEFEKIRNGDKPDGCQDELISDIDLFLENMKNNITKSGESVPERVQENTVDHYYIAPAECKISQYYKMKITYKSDTQMANLRAYSAVFALRDIAEDIQYIPEDIVSDEDSSSEILANGFKVLLQTQSDQEDVLKLIDSTSEIDKIEIDKCSQSDFTKGFCENESNNLIIDLDSDIETIEKRVSEKEQPKPGDYVITNKEPGKSKVLAKQHNNQKNIQQSYISVNVNKMDLLMDLIGEIVIAQSVVLHNSDLKIPGLNLSNFKKSARQLTKFTSELQDIILSMRMMPLVNTFNKMNRIVFDTSRKLNKDIELKIVGENTEVDKGIIENISDPLMHLIRNAVDHGIESKEDRIKASKDQKGTIILEAKNEGGKVYIIVKDDGYGMNPDVIFNKAKEKGVIDSKSLRTDYTDKEIFKFITYPGFSTKEQVTELSGRGVGMDVVVKNIQTIGGRLEIDSKIGYGSTFTLKIPLTLAIIEGIVIVVGETTFVVETNSVKEFVSMKDSKIVIKPDGEEFAVIREECLPVMRLDSKFKLGQTQTSLDKGIMIILEHENNKICVVVDKLIGQQEIVVKPIPPYIKHIDGISGCTQLGDGSLAFIIDTGGLI